MKKILIVKAPVEDPEEMQKVAEVLAKAFEGTEYTPVVGHFEVYTLGELQRMARDILNETERMEKAKNEKRLED